ncbi:MAG: UDP-2,3-diacylglucosamine diphosphatase LpxI [Pyrinomonadaceae bacterium]|nr:UDP-2,3-diacylglucosamine diphosphatase LpxI [Pyrinomonadaceae bacterium]MCX7639154.1 UDP-2,3-diacylglucosamine diphosphatase LpxI [Pyrinomonadaceae bacterium]MDW8303625.1 UDP-2,3-diacylglucosamine diphosphatase LpxI [Acidobacteriota bacterium]
MKYGLIAGNGQFPFLAIEEAKRAGASLSVVAIREETDKKIEEVAEKVCWVGIGQLNRMINFFKKEGITKVMMCGQVKHTQIFSDALPDLRMIRMLFRLRRRNTDALIGAVAEELAKEGIELIDSTFFLKKHLAEKGILTKRKPNHTEREDIEYGLEVAREIARLDLGQTIVVRAKACVAIEAMEGTDETIRRAGRLARGKLTVVKVAKPNQDMRFDVPVVGVPTIEVMKEAGATCLCITAGKTLMFEKYKMISLADKERICIVAVE